MPPPTAPAVAPRNGTAASEVDRAGRDAPEPGVPDRQGVPAARPSRVADLSAEDLDMRRHRLAERLLTDVIGLPWELVHDEAETWGLEVSDRLDARLVELLDDPATCPHGNPIPGTAHPVDQSDAVVADEVEPGRVEVVRITEDLEEDQDALVQLARAGLLPGRRAEITHRDDDGLHVVGARGDTVLGAHITSELWLRPLADPR